MIFKLNDHDFNAEEYQASKYRQSYNDDEMGFADIFLKGREKPIRVSCFEGPYEIFIKGITEWNLKKRQN